MTTHTLIDRRNSSEHDIDADPINRGAAKLYRKRQPIYPKLVHGVFRRTKWIAMIVLLGIYYLTPWLRWDRGPNRPDQAVLIDFEGRRFYFGPIELWPHELTYIAGLLILAGLGIFLTAALLGRVWCGYACPQTVWTDLYLYVERVFEGDRNQRMKRAGKKLTIDTALRKVGKHGVWIAIAVATGGAWIFYFGDAPTLLREIFSGQASPAVYGAIGLFTFTTYVLAGTMREQVCIYMCPWPRIQAAMTDPEALNVQYQSDRGEPRGHKSKDASWEGRGDCIDCHQCVAACPMGIDIRDGAQLECIQCALCIDACDTVMRKVGRPTGLIAYDHDLNIQRRKQAQAAAFRWLRPRTMFYGVLMAAIATAMVVAFMNRSTLDVSIDRDRSPAFVKLADGSIRNGYTIKILNMEPRERVVTIRATGAEGLRLKTHAGMVPIGAPVQLLAHADTVTSLHLFVAAPASELRKGETITLLIEEDGIVRARRVSAFLNGATS